MSTSAAERMIANDRASRALGMSVRFGDPGHAKVTMQVREDMTNGFEITHGGLVFALADTAFAVACNEDDRTTVSAGADIQFFKSTRVGDVLTATAARRSVRGRAGVYDVTVTDQDGEVVAEFRGRSLITTRDV